MDKNLDYKLQQFKKALNSLAEVLQQEKTDIVRDSTIKRFEYCHEIVWKLAKIFLLEKFGVDAWSPKACFRSLGENKLINDQEVELLLQMTDDRNEIIHTYNENFSEMIYQDIKEKYFVLLNKIYENLFHI